MAETNIEEEFPSLWRTGYTKTSEDDDSYNCFAWAAGDSHQWWSPTKINGYYWPPDVPLGLSVEAFIKLYEVCCGYVPCVSGHLEEGFEKIAIYADSSNQVCHAARQTPSGKWSSKLGIYEDVEHSDLSVLESDYNASVVQFLKRPRVANW